MKKCFFLFVVGMLFILPTDLMASPLLKRVPVSAKPSITKAENLPTEWIGTIESVEFYDTDYLLSIAIGEDMVLYLDFSVDSYEQFEGDYTTEQFLMDYTSLNTTNEEVLLTFTDIEMSLVAPDGPNGEISLTATLVGDDGVTYYLTVGAIPSIPTEWVGEITYLQYYPMDQDYIIQITFEEEKYMLQLDLITGAQETLEGKYTAEDFLMGATMLQQLSADGYRYETILSFTEISLTVVAPKGAGGTVEVTGTFIGEDGNTYTLTAHKAMPDPLSEIDIDATNLRTIIKVETVGAIPITKVTASNDNYAVETRFMGEGDASYSENYLLDMTIEDLSTGQTEEISVLSASMTLSEQGKHFTAEILSTDLIQYNLDFTTTLPDAPERTIVLTYQTEGILNSNPTNFQLTTAPEVFAELSNKALSISLMIKSETIEGIYTMEDIYLPYTFLTLSEHTTGENISGMPLGFFDITANIEKKDNKYMCHADFWGYDNVLYQIYFTLPAIHTALDEGEITKAAQKLLTKEGHIYIIRDGKTYTMTGARVH